MRVTVLGGWLTLVAAGLAGCGLGEADDYAPLTITDNFRVIADGKAYRSAQLDAQSFRLVIKHYNIRTIVNLRGENDHRHWYRAETAVAEELGVAHVDVRMSAMHLPPRAALLKLYDTFKSAEHPILIHCKAGADRTGAASAIWRMVVLGDSNDDAAAELSPLNGHFAAAHPEMDVLVAMFKPDRAWIENEYLGPQ